MKTSKSATEENPVTTRGNNPPFQSQFSNNNSIDSENGEKDIGSFRTALPQFLAVGVKNILLLGYGLSLGFPTIVIPAIQGGEGREPSFENDLILTKDQISWLSSINLICVPVGCIFSGAFTQPIGRRRAMQLVNLPILAAWLIIYFSTNIYHLYGGLCLFGVSGGLLEAPVLTYVAEVTQPRFRGMLAATGSTCSILGVLVIFIAGTFFKWRTVALFSGCVPIISIIMIFFIPESPHWLIRKNRLDEARQSLAWLRGWVSPVMVEPEIREINAIIRKNSPEDGESKCCFNFKLFASRSFIVPFTLISFVFFIGHFSGKTTLQTYSVQIFHTLKAPIDKYYATIFLGVCELLGTIVCVILVHFTGKRPLMLVSTIGCGLCFLGTATYAYYIDLVPGTSVNNIVANLSSVNLKDTVLDVEYEANKTVLIYSNSSENVEYFKNSEFIVDYLDESIMELNDTLDNFKNESVVPEEEDDKSMNAIPEDILIQLPKLDENKYIWLPLTLLLGSAFLTHIGIRLLPWMLIGEIFPANVRNVASGLAGGLGYIFGFMANKLFLTMIESMTLPGTFWFYAAVGLLGALILYFVLPETEGRSLMEIEAHYTGGKKLDCKDVPRPRSLELPRHTDVVLKTNGANRQQAPQTQQLPPAFITKISENNVKSRVPLATAAPPSTPADQQNGHRKMRVIEERPTQIPKPIKEGQIVADNNVLTIKIGNPEPRAAPNHAVKQEALPATRAPRESRIPKMDLKHWNSSELFEKHLQQHNSKTEETSADDHPKRTQRLNSLLLYQDNLHHTSMLLGMKKSRLVNRNNRMYTKPANLGPTNVSHEKEVYDTKL